MIIGIILGIIATLVIGAIILGITLLLALFGQIGIVITFILGLILTGCIIGIPAIIIMLIGVGVLILGGGAILVVLGLPILPILLIIAVAVILLAIIAIPIMFIIPAFLASGGFALFKGIDLIGNLASRFLPSFNKLLIKILPTIEKILIWINNNLSSILANIVAIINSTLSSLSTPVQYLLNAFNTYIVGFLKNIIENTNDALTKLYTFIGNIGDKLTGVLTAFNSTGVNTLKEAINKISESLKDAISGGSTSVGLFIQNILSNIGNMAGNLGTWLSGIESEFTQMFSGIPSALSKGILGTIGYASSVLSAFVRWLERTIRNITDTVGQGAGTLATFVVSVIAGIYGLIANPISGVVNFLNGLPDMLGPALGVLESVSTGVLQAGENFVISGLNFLVKFFLSGSAQLLDSGSNISMTIVGTITSIISFITNLIGPQLETLITFIANAADWLVSSLGYVAGLLSQSIPDIISWIQGFIKNIINNLIANLKATLDNIVPFLDKVFKQTLSIFTNLSRTGSGVISEVLNAIVKAIIAIIIDILEITNKLVEAY